MKLTDKQRRFVEEYCSNGFNATQAAISAGYSEKTAKDIACQNLAKLYIQESIQEFMSKQTKKCEIDTQWVVNKLKQEVEYIGEGSSPSARVSALKVLTDYTGGFDANKQKVETKVSVSDESELDW